MASPKSAPESSSAIREFFRSLGPGLITGAADDDPAGIATYSSAGALLGTSMLWTAFITWPLMGVTQFMCARIGMVTGEGLAGVLRRKFPVWLVVAFSVALLLANSLNIGADLSGMADAGHLMTGMNSQLLVCLFGVAIAVATVVCRYRQIANTLQWLALSLFSYVIAALVMKADWAGVVHDTFVPSLPRGKEGWGMLVAILGTTISPYLFYWQAAQETEEERALGRVTIVKRRGASPREILSRKLDVGLGTFFSNFVMYFIILTTALTLHRHGIYKIDTSQQAAQALKPIAGNFAATLFTLGLLGVGFLAIPTLSGSAAYALAETFRWKSGLDRSFRSARAFYIVIVAATLLGVAMNFAHINPVRALYWSAVVNGLLAPFVMVAILLVACDRKLMQGQPSSLLSRVVVGLTTFLMFVAGVGMFVV